MAIHDFVFPIARIQGSEKQGMDIGLAPLVTPRDVLWEFVFPIPTSLGSTGPVLDFFL